MKKTLKQRIGGIKLRLKTALGLFPGSGKYWEKVYSGGGNSGSGSYGKFAEFKAEILNPFIVNNNIGSVIEFGCGDGNQLSYFNFPKYVGLDVSRTTVKLCIERFRDDNTKSFFLYDSECFVDNYPLYKADLAISLDVLYHLIEYNIFELYMKHLFSASDQYVIIYSDDNDSDQIYHEKHRNFTKWVEVNLPEWALIDKIKNRYPPVESCADFFIYRKKV